MITFIFVDDGKFVRVRNRVYVCCEAIRLTRQCYFAEVYIYNIDKYKSLEAREKLNSNRLVFRE